LLSSFIKFFDDYSGYLKNIIDRYNYHHILYRVRNLNKVEIIEESYFKMKNISI